MRTRRGPFCKNDRKRLGCGPTKNSKKLEKSRETLDFTAFLGGPDRIRTDDPHNANVVRSQLRYRPVFVCFEQFQRKELCSMLFLAGPCYGALALRSACTGARHGNLTPPRVSPSCPHCLRLWLGRSIITRLLTRVGPVYNRSQCETARHRLFCGRMGTAPHLPWPSLMQVSAQVVLAHPPVSL